MTVDVAQRKMLAVQVVGIELKREKSFKQMCGNIFKVKVREGNSFQTKSTREVVLAYTTSGIQASLTLCEGFHFSFGSLGLQG